MILPRKSGGFSETCCFQASLERFVFSGHRFEIACNLLDGIYQDREKVVAGVAQFVAVFVIDNDRVVTFKGENVLCEEAVTRRTVGGFTVTSFLEVELFGLELLDKVKAVGDWAGDDFVTGVGNRAPCNLNVGVGYRGGTHRDAVVFGGDVECGSKGATAVHPADANIARAGGVGGEGICAGGSVGSSGGVATEGTYAVGSVDAAGGVAGEGLEAVSNVADAGGVAEEGQYAVGSVAVAGGVAVEGLVTIGSVVEASGVAVEGLYAVGSVEVASGVVLKGGGTVGNVAGAGGVV